MRRRSSGSSDEGDQSPVEVPPVTPDPDNQRPSVSIRRNESPKKLGPRPAPRTCPEDSRPSSARSRRSGNFTWKPSQSRNGSIEKSALASSFHSPSTIPIDMRDNHNNATKALANADAAGKLVEPKSPAVRRPRSRNPWSITIRTLVTSLVGIGFLAVILNSLVTRQLDPKGCRMSYMRPSYARLNDFDTEHTRFASKYSLYLYREQGVDDDTKVNRSRYRNLASCMSWSPSVSVSNMFSV
jgi:hypothetical protein